MSSFRDSTIILTVGRLDPECDVSLLRLSRLGYRVSRKPPDPDLPRLRNLSVDAVRSLEGPERPTRILFLDSDQEIDPFHADQLVTSAMRAEADVMGAIIARKAFGGGVACSPLPSPLGLFADSTGPFPVDFIGLGATVVTLRLLDRMAARLGRVGVGTQSGETFVPYFRSGPVFVADDVPLEWCSEDYHFCMEARASGAKMMADPSVRVGHWGRHCFQVEDAFRPLERSLGVTIQQAPKAGEEP